MERLLQDLRHAVRLLVNRPVFTTTAVASLALGIGATMAIFSLVNAAFVRPVPVDDPDRIVSVYATDASNPVPGMTHYPFSHPNYRDLRDRATTLSELAAYGEFQISLGGELPELVPAHLVTWNYFRVLGVEAHVGRAFLAEEDEVPGRNPVAVLSYALWKGRFGADRDVVGSTIELNGQPFTVVGVMPPGFRGPTALGAPQIWVPTMMHREVFPFTQVFDQRRWRTLWLLGRLDPGQDLSAAQAELQGLARRLEEEYPEENRGRGVQLLPLTAASVDPNERSTYVRAATLLLAAAGLVLTIAFVNVGNLLLARGIPRRKEMALRLSFGAGRGHLVQQLLVEGLVLTLVGTGAGLLLGFWGRNLLWSLRPPLMTEDALDLSLDHRVLLVTVAVSVVGGLLFSLIPARRASRQDLVSSLKQGERGSATGRGPVSLRGALVVAQVALCLVALVGAGLFLRSLQRTQAIDPGFAADELFHFSLNVGPHGYSPERGRELYRRLIQNLEQIPGVRSASVSETRLLVPGGLMRSVVPPGQDPTDSTGALLVRTSAVGPDYLETVGIPLLTGRGFTEADREGSVPVAVVNRTLAETLWPGEEAVGRRLTFFGEEVRPEVVGVAEDAQYVSLTGDPQPYIYLPILQRFAPQPTFYLRTEREIPGLAETARRELRELDPDLPVVAPMTVLEEVRISLWMPRMAASLLSLFGCVALALAAVGLYGVLATTVRQRERELGIRSALGASRPGILGVVLRRALLLVGAGVGLGLLAAFAATRLVASQLHGIEATDAVTYAGVTALLLATGVIAALLPAYRASRVDPLVALQVE